jgi:hypothetical protein
LRSVTKALLKSIKLRFAHIINIDSPHFDARFIVAAAVDPFTTFALSEPFDRVFPLVQLLVSRDVLNISLFNFRSIRFHHSVAMKVRNLWSRKQSCSHSCLMSRFLLHSIRITILWALNSRSSLKNAESTRN